MFIRIAFLLAVCAAPLAAQNVVVPTQIACDDCGDRG